MATKSDRTIERERRARLHVTGNDLRRLEHALCTLADYEGLLKRTLREVGDGASDYDHMHVCAALRRLVDGD
jgi:hypothetical protein